MIFIMYTSWLVGTNKRRTFVAWDHVFFGLKA
jgi:hypothetical protein